MFYVYILLSLLDGSRYRGFTTLHPEERLLVHNRGNVSSTRLKCPWKIVWYGAFASKQKAIDFERYLKSGSGHAFANTRFLDEKYNEHL